MVEQPTKMVEQVAPTEKMVCSITEQTTFMVEQLTKLPEQVAPTGKMVCSTTEQPTKMVEQGIFMAE